ncbi:biliverdin-producing heme oxygenase [Massilia arenosa]|uniref:Biliverdin-producing heme oxygenase n=1 Tax=Zemynaea arenosa TaxID=2561931 RepID=A0A4Y9SDL4_9BURK|nr:biliverdin-producing heme oxygenase [Massilia arenosa]TFW20844.1 biliverdin-producing heme oxygenase [Massilia arenosa]
MSVSLAALRQATAALHADLETHLDIAAADADRATYLHYLEDLYGWMAPFDADLWSGAWPAGVDAPARAGKLAWIEADLAHAAFSPADIAALPRCADRPDLSSAARRFGVAYVIEGAQLGTKVLQHRLRGPLAGWEPRWLEGYGSSNGPHWRGFLHALDEHVVTRQEIDDACAAAADTFASLARWFAGRRAARALAPALVSPVL